MALESGTYVSELVSTNPVGATDTKSQGDDHLRLLKAVLQNTFPVADKPFYFPNFLAKTTTYLILAADDNKVITASASGAAFTMTLPTLTAAQDGWSVTVVKIDSTANVVTIAGTINGVTNFTLERQYEMVTFRWSGTAWYTAAVENPLPFRVVTKTATATLTLAEMGGLVLVTPAAAVTITPPAATAGAWVYVKNVDGAFAVTFNPPGAVTVDGQTTFVLESNDEAALFVSDGTNWHVAAHYQGEFPEIPAHPVSSVVNLVVVPHASVPDSRVTITADEVVLVDPSGNTVKHLAVSLTLNILAAVGVNAMDVAGDLTTKEIFVWIISDGTTVACIGHRSNAGAPTMPGAYTYKKLVYWTRTDGTGDLYRVIQRDRLAQYVVGDTPANAVVLADGTVGTYSSTSPTLVAQALGNLVPANATSIVLGATNRYQGGGPAGVLVAPNADYDGANRGPGGTTGVFYPIWLNSTNDAEAIAEIQLESTNVYYAGAGGGSAVFVLGWRFPL